MVFINNTAALSGSIYKSNADLVAISLFDGCSNSLLQFAFVCCVIFILVGIPGNFITIIALTICEKFRNATAYFIINLHINNLVYCCLILPMTATIFRTKHWTFGITMCSVYPFIKYVFVGTAHFTVVAITVNRYIIVCHPHIYRRLYNRSILITTLLFTWLAPAIMFLPTYFKMWGRFDLEPIGGSCTIVPDINNRCPKTFFICFAFVGPYLTIILCYSRIWWTVRKVAKIQNARITRALPAVNNSLSYISEVKIETSLQEFTVDDNTNNTNTLINSIAVAPNGEDTQVLKNFTSVTLRKKDNNSHLPTRKDKKLATMIVAILVSFLLCHLPLMMTRLINSNYKSHSKVNILAHLLEYSTAFISPLIYVMMSKEYRQAYEILYKTLKSKIVKCLT